MTDVGAEENPDEKSTDRVNDCSNVNETKPTVTIPSSTAKGKNLPLTLFKAVR